MKKTVTANISGIVFHIDEDAYEKLNQYLGKIRSHFYDDESGDEILSDIESRIAEMLQVKMSNSKQVITIKDINEVVIQLGQPGQMKDEDPDPNAGHKKESPKTGKTSKRLYRDPDNQMLSGVCGGIGAYFNVDPTWIRIAFILLTLLYTSGIIAYIILWIVVPKARTTAEKLEMRGEKVNISNIEKSFKEEMEGVKTSFDNLSKEAKEKFKKKRSNDDLNEASNTFAKILGALLKAIGIIIGIALVVAGLFMLITITISFIAPGVEPFSFFHTAPFWLRDIVHPGWLSILAITGLLLVIGIPVIGLIYLGAKLIFDIDSKSKSLPLILVLLWILGIMVFILAVIKSVLLF